MPEPREYRGKIADLVDAHLHGENEECSAEEYREGLLSLADSILDMLAEHNLGGFVLLPGDVVERSR